MLIRQTFQVRAPLDTVWEFLNDPPRIGRLMPYVEEVTLTADNVYSVKVCPKIGPIKPQFVGSVEICEVIPPQKMLLQLDWRDKITGSKVGAPGEVVVSERPDDSVEVAVEIKITILGALGKFGQPIAEKKASEITQVFAERVRAELEAEPETAISAEQAHQ